MQIKAWMTDIVRHWNLDLLVCSPRSVLRISARAVPVASSEFGGMANNDGPVPVRTLAQAARLIAKLDS